MGAPESGDIDAADLDAMLRRWSSALRATRRLTRREHETFILLGDGLSNQDLARRLRISERAVKQHVTAILSKLRLESRLQAGIVACLHRIRRD